MELGCSADETSSKAMWLHPGFFLMLMVKCERKVVSGERNSSTCKVKSNHHPLILKIVNQRGLQKMLTLGVALLGSRALETDLLQGWRH